MSLLHEVCQLPRGTVTITDEFSGLSRKVVYQRVHRDMGNLPAHSTHGMQLRTHVIPFDPKTPSQLLRRGAMADAVAAWQVLPSVDRDKYHAGGVGVNLPAYQYFISQFLKGEVA